MPEISSKVGKMGSTEQVDKADPGEEYNDFGLQSAKHSSLWVCSLLQPPNTPPFLPSAVPVLPLTPVPVQRTQACQNSLPCTVLPPRKSS